MPPKEKVSKATVQETAFEMTREYGFAAVTARRLADRLGCSTQPIFRAYENMEELRTDLYYMSTEYFSEYMMSRKSRTNPGYLTIALAYINLAVKEKNLFELIASIDDFGSQTIQEFLKTEEGTQLLEKLPSTGRMSDDKKRELFMMLWMFVHGLAVLLAGNRVSLNDKQIKEMLVKAYEGFRSQIKA